ncbi:MAG: hypothetical protein V5A72_03455 [Candidatus Nanohaloarchaea archaeon]
MADGFIRKKIELIDYMNFRDLDNLLVYEFLKNFGISLIGVFIPIYILSQGKGILPASLFIIISGVAGVILSYPISRVISKIGFKHSLIASYFFLIPGIMVIRMFELSVLTISVSSVLYNIGRLTHNIGLNSEFAVDSSKEKRAEDSGKMLSLPSISRVIAPLAGGVIFAGFGFTNLMFITVFILLLSVLPLIFSSEHRDPMNYNMKQLLQDEFLKTIPLFIIRGIQAVGAVAVFGMFIYLIVGGSVDVGSARALDSLGFVITGLLVGRYATKIRKDLFVTIGCIGAGSAFFLRGFIATPIQAFLLSFISGIFFQIYHIPIYSSFADEAEDTEILEFYTLRKIFVSVGNILVIGTLAVFYTFYDLKTGFHAAFTLGGLSTFMMAAIYWKNRNLN